MAQAPKKAAPAAGRARAASRSNPRPTSRPARTPTNTSDAGLGGVQQRMQAQLGQAQPNQQAFQNASPQASFQRGTPATPQDQIMRTTEVRPAGYQAPQNMQQAEAARYRAPAPGQVPMNWTPPSATWGNPQNEQGSQQIM